MSGYYNHNVVMYVYVLPKVYINLWSTIMYDGAH